MTQMNSVEFKKLIDENPKLVNFLQYWEELDANKEYKSMEDIWNGAHHGVHCFLVYHMKMAET
eukprot:gene3613-6429_t